MNNFFAGILSFFMGITSFFHGVHATPPLNQGQSLSTQQASTSGTPSPLMIQKKSNESSGMESNIPNGDKPFFGEVTNVNGSTITLKAHMMITTITGTVGSEKPNTIMGNGGSVPSDSETLIVNLTSSTRYLGGSKSDITINTRVAGYGTVNSDGSITAIQFEINPTPKQSVQEEGPVQIQNGN